MDDDFRFKTILTTELHGESRSGNFRKAVHRTSSLRVPYNKPLSPLCLKVLKSQITNFTTEFHGGFSQIYADEDAEFRRFKTILTTELHGESRRITERKF